MALSGCIHKQVKLLPTPKPKNALYHGQGSDVSVGFFPLTAAKRNGYLLRGISFDQKVSTFLVVVHNKGTNTVSLDIEDIPVGCMREREVDKSIRRGLYVSDALSAVGMMMSLPLFMFPVGLASAYVGWGFYKITSSAFAGLYTGSTAFFCVTGVIAYSLFKKPSWEETYDDLHNKMLKELVIEPAAIKSKLMFLPEKEAFPDVFTIALYDIDDNRAIELQIKNANMMSSIMKCNTLISDRLKDEVKRRCCTVTINT